MLMAGRAGIRRHAQADGRRCPRERLWVPVAPGAAAGSGAARKEVEMEQIQAGRVTRRSLFRLALPSGGLLATGGTLLAACGMPGGLGGSPGGSVKPAALEVWIVDWAPTT